MKKVFPYIWCNCESIIEFFDGIFSADFQPNCAWLPLNHWFFQIANICVMSNYFINPTTRFGLLILRFFLMMTGFSFAFWGAFILGSLDTVIWNLHLLLGMEFTLLTWFIWLSELNSVNLNIFRQVGIRRCQYEELLKLAERRVCQEIEQTENK